MDKLKFAYAGGRAVRFIFAALRFAKDAASIPAGKRLKNYIIVLNVRLMRGKRIFLEVGKLCNQFFCV